MERLKFLKSLLDDWVNMEDKKKISYITGVIITILCIVIYMREMHYNIKLTEKENENTKLRNEHTIVVNGIISRYNGLLVNEQEKTKQCTDNFIKYLEKNENEVRDLLFKTEKLKNKK